MDLCVTTRWELISSAKVKEEEDLRVIFSSIFFINGEAHKQSNRRSSQGIIEYNSDLYLSGLRDEDYCYNDTSKTRFCGSSMVTS